VTLVGAVPHEKMIERLTGYKALILCSNPETFGLVYVEGLRGGIPLIFSRGCGFDGFLEEYDFGLGVPNGSVDSISQAIRTMMSEHARFKRSVKKLQEARELDFFSRVRVAERLRDMYGRANGASAHSVGELQWA
jgi:glycosyltransferase involved in cell wall biosynthesis